MILKISSDKQVFIYDSWKIPSNAFYIFLVFFFFWSLARKQLKYRMSNLLFYQTTSMNIENFTVEKQIKTERFEVSDMINKHKKIRNMQFNSFIAGKCDIENRFE